MIWRSASRGAGGRTPILLLAFLLAIAADPNRAQTSHTLRSDRIDAQVEHVTVNPDSSNDLIVSVRVTIHTGNQTLVVPNCAEDSSGQNVFCVAQLARAKGRIIRVRNGLMATLGVESSDKWNLIVIPPRSEDTFNFSFETGLLDVRPGESLRVKFQVWPDVNSVHDWKSAIPQLTPIFRCPSKPS